MSDSYSGVTPSQTYHHPPPQYHHGHHPSHPTQYSHYQYTTTVPQALHVQQQQQQQQPQRQPQHHPPPPPVVYRNDSSQSVASTSQPHVHLQQTATAAPALTGEGGSTASAGPNAAGPNHSEIIASRTDDWTASLVRLAKSAELKKHALTLQLQTTKILSYNSTLQKKTKALNDYKKQRERLEAQRASLLNQLREVNENREKVDLEESKAQKECDEVRRKVQELKTGDYAMAKASVDKLRQELGMEEIKSIEMQLEEKNSKRKQSSSGADTTLTGLHESPPSSSSSGPPSHPTQMSEGSPSGLKRSAPTIVPNSATDLAPPQKRPRGRPKGSKNKPKEDNKQQQEPGMNGAASVIQTTI